MTINNYALAPTCHFFRSWRMSLFFFWTLWKISDFNKTDTILQLNTTTCVGFFAETSMLYLFPPYFWMETKCVFTSHPIKHCWNQVISLWNIPKIRWMVSVSVKFYPNHMLNSWQTILSSTCFIQNTLFFCVLFVLD